MDRTAAPPAPPPLRLPGAETSYTYDGDGSPQSPGGMAAIYRDLVADDNRLQQVVQDVVDARERGRHCLVLTQWTSHLERLTAELTACGHEPVVLRGGMGAKHRTAALAQLEHPNPDEPLLVAATGPFVGEGFDCPALDTLFLAAPIAFKGRLVQYVGRILRPYPGKTTAEVHDYHGLPGPSVTDRFGSTFVFESDSVHEAARQRGSAISTSLRWLADPD